MVHVSMVSGTPLGLRDMTVISQITDRWRDGARRIALFTQLSLRALAAIWTYRKQTSPSLTKTMQASQCNLHLPYTLEHKLPSGWTLAEGRKNTVSDSAYVCRSEADSSSHPDNLNIRPKLSTHSIFLSSPLDVVRRSQKKKTAVWVPNYWNLLYNDNP